MKIHYENKDNTTAGINLDDVFDHKFYLDIYLDLNKNGIHTREQALKHFKQFGISEGRAFSKENMRDRFTQNLQNSVSAISKYSYTNGKYLDNNVQFSILVRTSNRPDMCKKCIDSILSQTYHNFHIYICYDDEKSLDYLHNYDTDKRITYFPVKVESNEKYHFNLYCNLLMEKVSDGYIIFLDDDDMFISPRVLEIINNQTDTNNIIVWRFLRPDKFIYPKSLDTELVLGEIGTACVCFHHSLKNVAQWEDKQCGDYYFYATLFKACKRNQIILLEYALTSTQFDDKIGNYGNSI